MNDPVGSRPPAALRAIVAAAATLGALSAGWTLWQAGPAPGVDRDGGLAVLAVALAAAALASGARALAVGALIGLTTVALLLALPLLAGTMPGELALRAPFAALCALAALALAARLWGRPAGHDVAALLAGTALAAVIARLLSALAGDPGSGVLWPVPRLFIAPLALVPLLAWPAWDVRRRRDGAAAALAHLLVLQMLGIVVLALLGHLLGSPLLTTGIGQNAMPVQAALATGAGGLFLRAVVDRRRTRHAWGAALALYALGALASIAVPSAHELLSGRVLPGEGVEPGRALIIGVFFLLLAVAGLAASAERPRAWPLRLAQGIGLFAAMAGSVGVSGMIAEVLYGVDPILGANQLSFLGLFSLGCAGTAVFVTAAARTGDRRRRTESLPAAVTAAALALTISLWGGASRQAEDAILATGDVALEAMARTIAAELESRDRDLGRVAARLVEEDGGQHAAVLASAAAGLGIRYRTLARLTWLPADGGLLSTAAPRPDLPALRPVGTVADLTDVERRLLRAARRGVASAFGAAPAEGGLPRILALVERAERPGGDETGALVALFAIDDSQIPLLVGNPVPGFGASLVLDGVPFGVLGAAALPAPGSFEARFLRESLAPMYRMPLRIAVWPQAGTVERLRSRLPQAILVGGTLISALLAVVTVLAGAARERARLAQAAQRAAEDSRREVAELLEGLPDAFIAYDREWRFTHLNRAAEELSRVRRDTVVGRVLWEVSPGARADFGAHYERSMSLRTIERFEVHYAPLRMWLSVQSFPLPGGIGVVARDISGEHRMLDALRRREADLAQALDMADLARLEMDADERVTWSGAATKVLGRAEEDLPTDRAALRAMWHPEDAAAMLPVTAEGIHSGRGFDLEHRIVLRDGSVRWVHTVAQVITDGSAAPRVVATVQDITERRLQARAVQERDRFFEGSRDLFCILSRSGLYLQVNPALCRLLGFSREALIGRRAFDFTHPDDRERTQLEFRQALAGGPRAPTPARALTRDGGSRWIQWNASLSPEGDLYAVGHDVTERLAAEAERERTLAELQARNEELQQFAYIASHDLQEPLRKIQAFGDRLRTRYGEALDADGRDYLARMDNAARRMSTLIADLLEYSRVATRGAPFAPVALDDVLDDVLGDLEESIRAAAADIVRGPLPVVEADRTQMAQLLQNLIGNALKYRHPARAPRVEVRAERIPAPAAGPGGAPAAWMRLVVADNGIGFDPLHRERIFAPFQRLHGRAEYAGTGIGLAIVRKIVERHGGRVSAEGRPEAGATFTVELPLRQQ